MCIVGLKADIEAQATGELTTHFSQRRINGHRPEKIIDCWKRGVTYRVRTNVGIYIPGNPDVAVAIG